MTSEVHMNRQQATHQHAKRLVMAAAVLTVVMGILLSVLLFTYGVAAELLNRVTVKLTVEDSEVDLDFWMDPESGLWYLFLPSFADVSSARLVIEEGYHLYVNDKVYQNGDALDAWPLGEELSFSLYRGEAAKEGSGKLIVMRSSPMAALFIKTASGSMDRVHSDATLKETGEMVLITEDGALDYDGTLKYIKGRGNQTWRYEKKPYNLKLSRSAPLLGMSTSTSWCLLANYTDTTSLRNKIVYGVAEEMDFAYTPDTTYVQVYTNGEYAGLYLLTEKVEIGDYRVDIPDLSFLTQRLNEQQLHTYPSVETDYGKYYEIPLIPNVLNSGYLLELELSGRYEEEASWFITENGQSVAVKSPEYIAEEQLTYLSSLFSIFESALLAEDGVDPETGVSYLDLIDEKSWARKFVIEELFGNQDTEWSSQYFYVQNGVIYAGPVWDYDHTMGNGSEEIMDPKRWISLWRGKEDEKYASWYSHLFRKDEFMEIVRDVYEEEVRVLVCEAVESAIPDYVKTIGDSVAMNSVRWKACAPETTFAFETQEIISFLRARIAFLDDNWIDMADSEK